MFLMVFLLLLLLLTLHGIGHLRGDLLQRGPVKLALSVGLLPDSVARTFACLATATPVVGLSPWREGTPFLIVGECTLKRIGVPLATLFRLAVLFSAFVAMVLLMPATAAVVPDPQSLSKALETSVGTLFGMLAAVPYSWLASGLVAWLALAFLAAMVLAAGLRARETVSALLLGAGSLGLLEGARWLGLQFGAFSNGWFLQRFYEADAGRALVLLLLVGGAVMAFLALLHLVPMALQKIRPAAQKEAPRATHSTDKGLLTRH